MHSTTVNDDHYKTLGLPSNAPAADIKKAYYRLAKVYHPDKNNTDATLEMFKKIQKAYEILSDPSKRAEYDLSRNWVGSSKLFYPSSTEPNPSTTDRKSRRQFGDSSRNFFHFGFSPFDGFPFQSQNSSQSFFNDNGYFTNDRGFKDALNRFDRFMEYVRMHFFDLNFKFFDEPFKDFNNVKRNYTKRSQTYAPGTGQQHQEPRQHQRFANTSAPSSQQHRTRTDWNVGSRNQQPAGRAKRYSNQMHMCRYCGNYTMTLTGVIEHEKLCTENPANVRRRTDVVRPDDRRRTVRTTVASPLRRSTATHNTARRPSHNLYASVNDGQKSGSYGQVNSVGSRRITDPDDNRSEPVSSSIGATAAKPVRPNRESHVARIHINFTKPERHSCKNDLPTQSTIRILVS